MEDETSPQLTPEASFDSIATNKNIHDSVEKINPTGENSEKISHSVSSRIVFGTPANTVGVKERVKGVIEKVKNCLQKRKKRKPIHADGCTSPHQYARSDSRYGFQ